MKFKASNEFKAQVFLNGKEVHNVVEMEAATQANNPIQGSVICHVKDLHGEYVLNSNNDIVRIESVGIVIWKEWTDEAKLKSEQDETKLYKS